MGKTGEWTVTDKTVLTPGPRLPERQHAGWQVSRKSEDEKDEVSDDKVEEKTKMDEKGSEEKKKKKKAENLSPPQAPSKIENTAAKRIAHEHKI